MATFTTYFLSYIDIEIIVGPLFTIDSHLFCLRDNQNQYVLFW